MRDGQPLTIDGNVYQMTQTVMDRFAATYDNVLTINQPVANIEDSTFTCIVTNILGSDESDGIQVTGMHADGFYDYSCTLKLVIIRFGSWNIYDCVTNNGGCAQVYTDTAISFLYTATDLGTDGRICSG